LEISSSIPLQTSKSTKHPKNSEKMMTGVSTPDPISKEKVFPTIRSKKDPAHTMHAVEWRGSRKVRVVETPRPLVTEPKDAIIRTTA
jgi:hypothetical protein